MYLIFSQELQPGILIFSASAPQVSFTGANFKIFLTPPAGNQLPHNLGTVLAACCSLEHSRGIRAPKQAIKKHW